MRLATLAWGVGRPASLAEYATRLNARIAEAAPQADLLLMPEYACMELAPALATAPGEAAELAAITDHADAILATMRHAARTHAIWLQPGTLPMRTPAGIINRAPIIRPDGSLAFQDKWQRTRYEAERWHIARGAPPQVFDTPWGRIGISICYDAEFPKHVRAQVEAGAWLILIPTCTDTAHGFTRVAISARARAIENQCYTALAPTVGTAPWSAALDTSTGQAAIFGPADRGFAPDGIIATTPIDTPGWLFHSLDEAAITAVRNHGAVRNHSDWPHEPMPTPRPATFQ